MPIANIIHDWALLWQELSVALLATVLLTVKIALGKDFARLAALITAAGLTALFFARLLLAAETTEIFFGGMATENSFTRQIHLLLIGGTLLSVLLHRIFPDKNTTDNFQTEYHILLCGALSGLLLMTRAQNLLLLFIALELVSVCSYGLVFFASGKQAVEAGVKYILFGIFSSALMLYGISLYWSIEGSLDIPGDLRNLPQWGKSVIFLLILSGLFFKTSAAPFHVWTPDVFQGAPLSVVTFFAVIPKAGALAAVMTLYSPAASGATAAVAILSFLIGTAAALRQTNMRRLMAYSSVAQAGFLLAATIAQAQKALIYYLQAYLLMNFLAFAVTAKVEASNNSQALDAFNGTGVGSPLCGVAMLIGMAGLIGLPPTAGFAAKLLVFSALWQKWQQTEDAWLFALFIAGFAATVISVYFYLQAPFRMFFKQGQDVNRLTFAQKLWLLTLSAALIGLLLGS